MTTIERCSLCECEAAYTVGNGEPYAEWPSCPDHVDEIGTSRSVPASDYEYAPGEYWVQRLSDWAMVRNVRD